MSRQRSLSPIEQQNSTSEKRNLVDDYQKTLEREDIDSFNFSDGRKNASGEVRYQERRSSQGEQVDALKGNREVTTSSHSRPEPTPVKTEVEKDSSKEKRRGIISIPSANDEDDDDDDEDLEEEYRNSQREEQSPRRSQLPPAPPDSSMKPTTAGDLAGTLDMLDSSLGSVDSTSLPEMSPHRSTNAETGNDEGQYLSNSQTGNDAPPAMGLKKKKGSPAAAAAATAATSQNPKKQQTRDQKGEFTSRVGRQRSEEDDEDDDIFEREAKSDAKEKEDANLAYQRMMSTMKSESSTSRAVNTNKALDSSSEDELENAIQKAVLGSKAKSKWNDDSCLGPLFL